MPSIVKRVSDVAARIVLTSAQIGAIVEHDGFRTIELISDRFTSDQWVPGDKLRVRADDLALRTYTPISWDRGAGSTRLLAYMHGPGPGAQWCRAVATGSDCLVSGPDHSVRLDRIDAAPVFVGDETSFGLLTAWRATRPDMPPVAALFEVNDVAGARSTLHDHDCDDATLVARAAGDAHLAELGSSVLEVLRADPAAPLCITGRAQTIAAVRRRLKSAGVAPPTTIAKAYWDVNRKGLD